MKISFAKFLLHVRLRGGVSGLASQIHLAGCSCKSTVFTPKNKKVLTTSKDPQGKVLELIKYVFNIKRIGESRNSAMKNESVQNETFCHR